MIASDRRMKSSRTFATSRRVDGAGPGQCGMLVCPDVLGRADIVERLIADLQQAALLEVGRGDAPAPAQVAVEPVGQHISQGPPGLGGRGEAHVGIARVKLDRQIRVRRRPFGAGPRG